MLVLSRQVDESIMVGDIEIMVCKLQDGRVKLGIIAPRDVPVHRKEIYEAIRDGVAKTDRKIEEILEC